MRKAQIAEWILSLFTSRELAASTAGDWMEEVPTRGAFWFWSSVLRTAFSFVWRDISAEPLHLTGLAFRAWMLKVAFLVAWLIVMICLAAIFGLFVGVIASAGAFTGGVPDWTSKSEWMGKWVAGPTGLLVVLAIEFQIGRWIARRARGREIAACIGYEIASVLGSAVVGVVLMRLGAFAVAPPPGNEVARYAVFYANFYASIFLGLIAVFTGAIWVRRRETVVPKVT